MIVYVTYSFGRSSVFSTGTPVPYLQGYIVKDEERGNLSFKRIAQDAGYGCTLEELL